MEAARKLADAHDFDGAVSRLEKLLAGAGPVSLEAAHVALVNKALAYCLGFRGVRRLNEAAQTNNEVPPTIMRIVERAKAGLVDNLSFGCAKMGNILPGLTCHCMACGSGIYSQYMTFSFRDVPMLVCGTCADKIRGEQDSGKARLRDAVKKSSEDFLRAGRLDPANKFVQKQIEQARELCSTVGVSFPSAPKEKKPKVSKSSAASAPSATAVEATGVCSAANWSLGLGLAGFLCSLTGIPAVICGHKALREIDESGGTLSGRGRARVGLVLGYISISILVITIIVALSSN
jgi:hypothetical protein